MPARPFLALIAAAALLSPPALAAETSSAKPGLELVKEWDFGKDCADLRCVFSHFHTRYAYDAGRLDHLPGNGDWQRYRTSANHRVENGSLALTARNRDGWQVGGFESGMIRSKYAQKFGYFEVRLRVPKGRGLKTMVELLPQDAVWPPSITVMAAVDKGPETRRISYHTLAGSGAAEPGGGRLDPWGGFVHEAELGDGFHVFAVDWTPDAVTHLVDGKSVARREFRWRHPDGSAAGPAQMVVTLAVGGHWAGPPMDAADFPATVEIDWMRIYRHGAPAISELPR